MTQAETDLAAILELLDGDYDRLFAAWSLIPVDKLANGITAMAIDQGSLGELLTQLAVNE